MISGIRVLIAEDQRLIATLLEAVLEDEGLVATVVESGEQALSVLGSDPPFEVLVTDIRMGSGPDGWEVATAARRHHPGIVVVYTTGDSMDEWQSKGVPNSLLVAKPFVPDQVVAAIRSLVGQCEPEYG